MTATEKAAALVLRYEILINNDFVSDLHWNDPTDKARQLRTKKDAKKCAMIVVEEVLNSGGVESTYWEAVKKEIGKL